jgi:hypothetical protein
MAQINISKVLHIVKEKYDDICTQLIASDEIGQVVRLHFPPTWENSANPQFNDWGGASINGTPYIDGNANNQKQVEVTAEIRMRVYSTDAQGFGRSAFKQLGAGKYVEGQLLTIGLMSDYTKVVDCIKADFYTETESTTGRKSYKLYSDVRPHGFGKDKFFFCFWEKIV